MTKPSKEHTETAEITEATEASEASEVAEENTDSPVDVLVLKKILKRVTYLWKLVKKRAPSEVVERVTRSLEEAEAVLSEESPALQDRFVLSQELDRLQAILKGQNPEDSLFYCEGRLAVVRAFDPIRIRGAVDQRRLEAFFERYVRRAEESFERAQYFLERSGLLLPDEAGKERKPWDQPYADLDLFRELLWGRV